MCRLQLWSVLLVAALLLPGAPAAQAAARFDLHGPAGSEAFGTQVIALTNGNVVVTDPLYDAGGEADVGAVYLYNGVTRALISTLTGSTASDQVGVGGVTALSNGNFVVSSPDWDNGSVTNAGAVTWVNGTTGRNGAVSASNSLVGSHTSDSVGSDGVTVLSNGNYVVSSAFWTNGSVINAGAVTWCNGTSGCSGAVSASNSLIGSQSDDRVGYNQVTALSNGNYVVSSADWDNGSATNAGAVTWGNGTTGTNGVVSASNSLVGSQTDDQVGSGGVTALRNGNYVVSSPLWNNGSVASAGAVTWGNGTSGLKGVVSTANSLVGSTAADQVGSRGVTALSNGNFVVSSPLWDNGSVTNVGAVTWGNGTSGLKGIVTTANSLVGSQANDRVGASGVTALSNGNYVVSSLQWTNGSVTTAGAVTWGNGTSGTSGAVSASNSLVGSRAGDRVGSGSVTALSNGNYVVRSPSWDNGATLNVGAVTWGNGTSGTSGAVATSNSLVGSQADDQVGSGGVTALTNGNYVVSSPLWNNGSITNPGAVTWGNGSTGIRGTISSANSLIGNAPDDQVGSGKVTALSNSNYVVSSPLWNNGSVTDAGAVTWGNGTTGLKGIVTTANSLVGSQTTDQTGWSEVTAVSNGSYIVKSPYWDSGSVVDVGAITEGNGSGGTVGPINTTNSVAGLVAGGGMVMTFSYDDVYQYLIVGRPRENIVTLGAPTFRINLPLVVRT